MARHSYVETYDEQSSFRTPHQRRAGIQRLLKTLDSRPPLQARGGRLRRNDQKEIPWADVLIKCLDTGFFMSA